MKIASITVYCDESFRLNSWFNYYIEYENELYIHIIVNNGDLNDVKLIHQKFPRSIIFSNNNKSLTHAYNLGIRYALSKSEIDAVLLIGNDIMLPKGSLHKLYNILYSNEKYGMIAPVLLLKDSNIVEIFGGVINNSNLSYTHLHRGHKVNEIVENLKISDGVPGGINLAKRNFYEIVGLQDENLFMYSDEIDIGIRARKNGFILLSTKDVLAWHQHINRNNSTSKSPMVGYLMGRNEIYLARKHFGIREILYTFFLRFFRSIRLILAAYIKNEPKSHRKYAYHYMKGTFAGLLNNLSLNNYLIKKNI